MPRRHKPVQWQPGPAGQWPTDEASQLARGKFTTDQLAAIVSIAGIGELAKDHETQDELKKLIERGVILIAAQALSWPILSGRARPPQRRAALKKVELAAKEFRISLESLDWDSRYDLRRALSAVSAPVETTAIAELSGQRRNVSTAEEMSPGFKYLVGTKEFYDLIQAASGTERGAAVALTRPADSRRVGNRRADMKNWVAAEILKFWVEIGRRPTVSSRGDLHKTVGPFLKFVDAIANPLSLGPMESAVRLAIKEWKKMGRDTPP